MACIRQSTEMRLHDTWAGAAEGWSTVAPDDAFGRYALRFGVGHMVAMGALDRARYRLSDLLFTGAYLDWCYTRLADDFTPVLMTWRALGADEAAASYGEALERCTATDAYELRLIRQVVEFIRDAGWKTVTVEVADAAVKAHLDVLGDDHPETGASMVQLGLALKNRKELEAAIPPTEKALAIQRRTWGPDVPDLYVTVNSLASMYTAVARFDEAKALYGEAVAQRGRLLGEEDPKTLVSVASMAHMLTKSGDHGTAEPMHTRAYEGRKRRLGVDHPKTLTTAVNLGKALMVLGRYEAAEEMLLNAVNRRRAILGPDHPRTLNAEKRLAECRAAAATEKR